MSLLSSAGLRPVLGWGRDPASEHSHQAQTAFPSLPPGGAAAARVVKGSVATVCPKGLGPGHPAEQSRLPRLLVDNMWGLWAGSEAGSWTGLWGSHACPPPSHKTTRVLAPASVELGQKEGPGVAFQKQQADVRAGSQDASVPGNGP